MRSAPFAFAHSGRNSGSFESYPMTSKPPPPPFARAWFAALTASQSEPLTSSIVSPAADRRSLFAIVSWMVLNSGMPNTVPSSVTCSRAAGTKSPVGIASPSMHRSSGMIAPRAASEPI